MGNNSANFESDTVYLNNLKNRTYMAGVSPWFFTVSPTQSFVYELLPKTCALFLAL